MLRHVRLDKHSAALGIKPSRQPVEQNFNRILFYLRSIRVIGRKCVPVSNEEEALVLVLHAHPVLQRPDIVAEVQLAGRAHAAENAFTRLGDVHFRITASKAPSTGASIRARKAPPQYTRASRPSIPTVS